MEALVFFTYPLFLFVERSGRRSPLKPTTLYRSADSDSREVFTLKRAESDADRLRFLSLQKTAYETSGFVVMNLADLSGSTLEARTSTPAASS